MASSQKSLASIAVQNPIFQQAAKNAVFEAVTTDPDAAYWEEQNTNQQGEKPVKDGSILDVSEEELIKIRKMARIMRFAMIGICTCLFIVSWYNFLSTSSSDLTTTFLAMYLFVFALLLCCFELAFRQAALVIVQNFGFMYSFKGRSLFLAFVAILSYQISTFGKVMFGAIIAYVLLSLYVYFKHPKFGKYLKTLHYFNRTKSKKPQQQEGGGGFMGGMMSSKV
jgi:FtsH-binding integral membrane protein